MVGGEGYLHFLYLLVMVLMLTCSETKTTKYISQADKVFINHGFNDINSRCSTIRHNPFP